MKLAKLCFFSEALRWGLAGTAWPGMWIYNLLLLGYYAGQCSYFSAPDPKPSAPLIVFLRHRWESKSSVGESKLSISLHPASDTEKQPGEGKCLAPTPLRAPRAAVPTLSPCPHRDQHNGPLPASLAKKILVA